MSPVQAPEPRFWVMTIEEKSSICMQTFSGRGAIGMCLGWILVQFGAISASFHAHGAWNCDEVLKKMDSGRIS